LWISGARCTETVRGEESATLSGASQGNPQNPSNQLTCSMLHRRDHLCRYPVGGRSMKSENRPLNATVPEREAIPPAVARFSVDTGASPFSIVLQLDVALTAPVLVRPSTDIFRRIYTRITPGRKTLITRPPIAARAGDLQDGVVAPRCPTAWPGPSSPPRRPVGDLGNGLIDNASLEHFEVAPNREC
jgi:hypothetical protein